MKMASPKSNSVTFEEGGGRFSVAHTRFFGTRVSVRVERSDLHDLFFFFRPYIYPSDEGKDADVDVVLRCSEGFFGSILRKDRAPKTIVVVERTDQGESIIAQTKFTDWSNVAAPLPPFASEQIQRTFSVVPGAVVSSPAGFTMVIRGAHYVGKTSLALALLEQGWSLVSDHLLIINRETGVPQQYLSPVGLRRRTLQAYQSRLRSVETRRTISEDTGLVVLVRPEELYPGQISQPASIDVVALLCRIPDARAASLTRQRLRLPPAYPAGFDISDALPKWEYMLSVPASMSPARIASFLATHL